MPSAVTGEFMGTMVLILFGDGVVASVLLKQSKGENAGWVAITAGWGLAVLAGIFTALACGSPDAHINPAVTLSIAVASNDYSKVIPYFAAQIAGAFVGAVLVWLVYLNHWSRTDNADFKLGTFCTIPAIRRLGPNLLTELIGTIALVFVGLSFGSKTAFANGLAPGFGPYLWAMLVWGIGLSLGGPTGYAINPARDFGPRLAHAVLPIPGKRDSDWGYAIVPVLGPLLAAAITAGLVKALHIL